MPAGIKRRSGLDIEDGDRVMLDMRTIVVMLLVASVLMTVTLAVGIRAGRGKGFVKWNTGLGLLALGWLLAAARSALPDLVGIAFADALLLTGLCVQLAAIIELGGGRGPALLLLVPGPLLFVLVIPLLGNYGALTLMVSLVYASAFAAVGVAAARLGHGAGPARWMLAVAYCAGAVLLPARGINIWLNPDLYPSLFAASNLHTATFVVLFAITVVGSVAFLLVHREYAEAELYRMATFDPLTGLFNRQAFMALAERERARSRRDHVPFTVLMMDLDFFKRINDEFGHQAGDRVLTEFSAAVKRSIRTTDLVGRYGGEEFCAILPKAEMPKALEIANRIRAAVAERPLAGLPRCITVSIGLVVDKRENPHALDAAIGRADEALYRAKHEGRDRVVSLDFSPDGEPATVPQPGPRAFLHRRAGTDK